MIYFCVILYKMLYRGQKKNNSNKRDTPDERVLFERLWKGTFQAVFAERSSKFRRALEAQNSKNRNQQIGNSSGGSTSNHRSESLPSYRCETSSIPMNSTNSVCNKRSMLNMDRTDSLECNSNCVGNDLRNLLSRMRRPCCCHCSCVPHELQSSQDINNLQVYLANDGQQKAMRSVIR